MDPSGTDLGDTVPVNTVAHQDGPPNNIPTLLERNMYHVPASPSYKESLDLDVTVACQNGSPNNLNSPLERNMYQINRYQCNMYHVLEKTSSSNYAVLNATIAKLLPQLSHCNEPLSKKQLQNVSSLVVGCMKLKTIFPDCDT